ncbi:MAG TPA: hypothetical protein PLL58_05775 [Candidatus Syntrophosphaera sp.]|nr:hypothetical protein [Candidatus Syntrophosphaera sp.]
MNVSAKSVVTGEAGWTCKNEPWVDSYFSVAWDASGHVLGVHPVVKATTKYLTGIPWEDILEEASDLSTLVHPTRGSGNHSRI